MIRNHCYDWHYAIGYEISDWLLFMKDSWMLLHVYRILKKEGVCDYVHIDIACEKNTENSYFRIGFNDLLTNWIMKISDGIKYAQNHLDSLLYFWESFIPTFFNYYLFGELVCPGDLAKIQKIELHGFFQGANYMSGVEKQH